MEPLLEGLLKSVGGSEANFLELCFGRFPYGNFHTKATSKKFRPPSGNFRPNPPPPETSEKSLHELFQPGGWLEDCLNKTRLSREAAPESAFILVWFAGTTPEVRKFHCDGKTLRISSFCRSVLSQLSFSVPRASFCLTSCSHVGRPPRGSYSRKGVFLLSRCLLVSPFLEHLLRTLPPSKPVARQLL